MPLPCTFGASGAQVMPWMHERPGQHGLTSLPSRLTQSTSPFALHEVGSGLLPPTVEKFELLMHRSLELPLHWQLELLPRQYENEPLKPPLHVPPLLSIGLGSMMGSTVFVPPA